jgi:hypothetical protein
LLWCYYSPQVDQKYPGPAPESSTGRTGDPIQIDQLWGIKFGGGAAADGATNQLFFTAGPDNNLTGLFGVINLVTAK